MKHEPDSGIAVDRMRRCASLASVKDLLLEAEEVLQYLKCHNGIVDQPINGNNNIVEDATDMHGVVHQPMRWRHQMSLQLSPRAYA